MRAQGTPPPPAPGWQPVDGNQTHLRYWDGHAWTAERNWDGSNWIDTAPEETASASDGSTKVSKLKRVGAAYATAGLSEVARSKRKRKEEAEAAESAAFGTKTATVVPKAAATVPAWPGTAIPMQQPFPASLITQAPRDNVVFDDDDEKEELLEDVDDDAEDLGPNQALYRYTVNYRGGHPDFPKSSAAGFRFELQADRFEIRPKARSGRGLRLAIPYAQTKDLAIVDRLVSTTEAVLGGLNSRQLNQKNNIEIRYMEGKREVIVRFEMTSGVTVMVQAKRCRELLDHIRNIGARDLFLKPGAQQVQVVDSPVPAPTSVQDIPEQIAKLAALRDAGALSEEEFAAKKTELLDRL
jgi:hypothetical protein